MRQRIENILSQLFTELEDFFLMARRTGKRPLGDSGTSAFDRKKQAGIHGDSQGSGHGRTLSQVPSPEIVPNHMAYHLAVKAVAFCETITTDRLEVIKALHQQFIECCLRGRTRSVDRNIMTGFLRQAHR